MVKLLRCCALLVLTGSLARAEAPFVALDGFNHFSANDDVPHEASKLLKQVQASRSAEIKSFAFTASGDWVFLFGTNGFCTSNLGHPACRKIAELAKDNNNIKCVTFAPTGGWTVLWGGNGNWTEGHIPEAAYAKMQEVIKKGSEPRSIAFGPRGAWVLLFDKSGVVYGNVPNDLAKVLDNAVRRRLVVRCVAFTASDWICLTSNGWSASDPDSPAAKRIAAAAKAGRSPKWVAVKPVLGPPEFAKFAEIIHRALDGKVAGGYAFAVLDRGKIAVSGAEGWARAPWEKEHPNLKWTLDKPMGIASVSKTVTAVGVLKLWEESWNTDHQFSLDDPFWPKIRSVCPKAGEDAKQITIRQLLLHRSGLKNADGCKTPHDVEQLLLQPLAHKPGAVCAYDNNNYYILRLVLEQIGHVDYTAYVKEHVLRPMGITGMETHYPLHQPMCGYLKPGNQRPGFPFDWKCESTAGPAGWYASVNELAQFLTGIREHKVLRSDTTEMMCKEGLGWDQCDPGCLKNGGWTWDEGSRPGSRAGKFSSEVARFPDGIDAVLLVNSESPESLGELLIRAWLEGRGK